MVYLIARRVVRAVCFVVGGNGGRVRPDGTIAAVNPPPVRVRFAPSPTGYLHIGGARTALFNWLYARRMGGEFVLRIEDTDTERSRPELIDVIFRALEWLGLDWDGTPVHQSERGHLHAAAVTTLLAEGRAYWCSCTPDEVKARAEARGGTPGYDGHCRDRGLGSGAGHVVRFRVPDTGTTAFDDLIRGHVSFENANLEDFVIQRSNGSPMFHLANAVDDAEQGITHVIRGEDLINVTPKVLLLREALRTPGELIFAHLPLIVNEKRQKLSKRRDDVSVGDYIDRGYLPEAMVNYLATLGWGPSDGIEIRPLAEIVAMFDVADVGRSGAFFDV
ncbi:MAG: glutamate--tRNA ligase, partial [Acidobacteria bacterium]|nr:glutamate--tRNA ligase [Acidobacteriota bacterium]